MKKASCSLPICFGIALVMLSAIPAQAAPPPLPFKTATTRREIGPDKPMFMTRSEIAQTYRQSTAPGADERAVKSMSGWLDQIPDDLRKYWVFETDRPALMDLFNERGVYFVGNAGQYSESNEVENLYKKYDYYLGPMHGEIQPDGINVSMKFMKRNLDLAKQYGGYWFWLVQGRSRILPALAAFHPEGADLMRQSGGRMIMLNRNNGQGHSRDNISELIGAWQSGIIGHWGFDFQNFMWGYESGLTRLFGEESVARVNPMSFIFGYPEALFGIEMQEAAALGATVYNWEPHWHMLVSPNLDKLSPCFKYVLVPLMRKIIHEGAITPKDQVQAATPAAILRPSMNARPLEGRMLFNHLQGWRYDDVSEWLPYNGRYLRVPYLLTGTTNAADLARYSTVVDTSGTNWEKAVWKTDAEKVGWFNRQFPAKGKGSSWFVHINDRWYLANHWINYNINTDFEIPLASAADSLSGVFTPHTFAIVREQADGLRIHLNNYRTDKDADFWPEFKDLTGWNHILIMKYLGEKYTVNPTDNELRESIIRLNGIDGEPKIKSITSEPGFERAFQHTASWDKAKNEYTILVKHNGPVDLIVDTTGCKRVGAPGDLAIFGMATASSCAGMHTLPDFAIDGNDRSTRWEALRPGSGQAAEQESVGGEKTTDGQEWLQVELRGKKTFNRIVLKEYLDRIVGYRIEYMAPCRAGACATPKSNAGQPQAAALQREEWIEIARGNGIGAVKTHEFAPITADKVRVVILQTKRDSQGLGQNPSLRALEIYGAEPGLSAPYEATASDIYEAEEDAVLGDGAARITGVHIYTKVFNSGYVRLTEQGKPFVQFMVNAAEAGAYRLSAHYTRGEWFGTGDGKLNIYVNGEFARTTTLPVTKSWDYWSSRPEVVALKPGLNTVEYRNDYGDFGVCQLDNLHVTRVTDVTAPVGKPEPMPASAEATAGKPEASHLVRTGRRYQAEEAQLAGGAASENYRLGYSGKGHASLGAAVGQSVTFKVQAQREGYHEVGLRYAFPKGSGASVSGYVNGTKAHRYELPPWPSGTGQGTKLASRPEGKWGLKVLPYWLAKGENTIAIQVDKGDTGNVLVDCLVVALPGPDFVAPMGLNVTNAVTVPLRGGLTPLVATVQPEKASVKDLIWESQYPAIATVSLSGMVRGLKAGKTSITVRLVGGGALSATCGVTANPDDVNIAPEAKVTVSSGKWKSLVDGVWGDSETDWVTGLENGTFKGKKPSIMLKWEQPKTIDRILLYGPIFEKGAGWTQAELTDSAGGKIKIDKIQNADKGPLILPFDPLSEKVEWINIEIQVGKAWTANGNGLGEIEVYGK